MPRLLIKIIKRRREGEDIHVYIYMSNEYDAKKMTSDFSFGAFAKIDENQTQTIYLYFSF